MDKNINKIVIYSLLGIGVLITSFFMRYQSSKVHTSLQKITIEENLWTRSNASAWRSDLIEITYPKSIPVSDSSNVKVKWVPRGPGHGSTFFGKETEPSNKLTLSGAAFDVKPSETLERKYEKEVGSAIWTWSISPKKEGSHELLLHLNSLSIVIFGGGDHYAYIKRNNEKPSFIKDPSLDSVSIPIEVLTKEGLSLQAFLAIKYSLAFVGFVLLYPAFSNLVTVFIARKSNHGKGTEDDKS